MKIDDILKDVLAGNTDLLIANTRDNHISAEKTANGTRRFYRHAAGATGGFVSKKYVIELWQAGNLTPRENLFYSRTKRLAKKL